MLGIEFEVLILPILCRAASVRVRVDVVLG